MSAAREEISAAGKKTHFSVGAIIQRKRKFFLIDRKIPPYGFAGLAGHVDHGETPENAISREVKEESNLDVIEAQKLFEEERDANWCSKGVTIHHWTLYNCKTKGLVKLNNREVKTGGWYTKAQLKNLELEEVWRHWFKRLGLL